MRAFWGLLVVLAVALGGCESKPVWEDTRYLERPPPQPPHCPDLPELNNITLKDGTIADVRIVQFRNTKMYFPADLVESAFIDETGVVGGKIIRFRHYLRKYDPDIYSKECPGVVHLLVDDDAVDANWPVIEVNPSPVRVDKLPAKNVSLEGFPGVYFTSWIDPSPPRQRALNGVWTDRFVWRSKLRVMVAARKQDVGRWQNSKSLNEFIIWLSTPPTKRNNDTIFTLKVDAQ